MKTFNIKDEPTILAIIAIILAFAALWAVGCGGGGAYGGTPTNPSPSGSGSTSANVTVNIVGSAGSGAFSPNPASVNAGQTVAFKNNDSTTHHMVANDGSWNTGDVAPGASSSALTVTSATSLGFHCTIHPTMVGSIN